MGTEVELALEDVMKVALSKGHQQGVAVCGRLIRLDLKRGHKPPTSKPKIRPVPKRRPALLAACARPVAKKVSRKTVGKQPKCLSGNILNHRNHL